MHTLWTSIDPTLQSHAGAAFLAEGTNPHVVQVEDDVQEEQGYVHIRQSVVPVS